VTAERFEKQFSKPLADLFRQLRKVRDELPKKASGSTPTSTCDKNGVIGNFIANRAEKEKANEYADIRKVVCTDINRDGEDDALVLYTLEGFDGGNGWTRDLATFVSRKGELEFSDEKRVGWKNYATVTDVAFRPPNEVDLTINTYAPTDGSCCPSIPGVENYTIDPKTLRLNTTKHSP
jgi:hypothetical protein